MKLLLQVFAILFIVSSCSETKKTQPATIEPVKDVPSYEVKFIQAGGEVSLSNGEVQLEKKPFSILLISENMEGIYLSASFKENPKFRLPGAFDDFSTLSYKVMAEKDFNTDNELIISEDSYSYWFYEPDQDWHRLNKVFKVGNKLVMEKKVDQYFIQGEGNLALDKNEDYLYLFFFGANLDDNGVVQSVFQRENITVKWY